jgi:hypothetical protein
VPPAFPLIAALALLASASAEAASFTTSPIGATGPHISNPATVMSRRPPCNDCGPKGPPPIPRNAANDRYDTSKDLNPGGGGGGYKPGRKPSLD